MKNVRTLIWLSLITGLLFLPLYGQTNFSTQVIVSDDAGNADTLTLGVNTAATYGIDPAFGEGELPPIPPSGIFDTRFVNIPGRTAPPPNGHGTGLSIDIRNLVDDLQTDTFRIRAQSGSDFNRLITFRWQPGLDTLGGGRWRLASSFSSSALINVDMVTQASATIDMDESPVIYIFKADKAPFRTFSLETLALDVDVKGKRGKANMKKSNQVEFCLTAPNNEPVPINGLFIQFKTPVDSSTLTVEPFTTIATDPKQKPNAKTKFTFSGATVDTGDLITICGYGVKEGTKDQGVASWYLTNGGVLQGKKKTQKIGIVFTKNIVRLPMPNTVNAGEQMMLQALPLKTDYLTVGSTTGIDGPKIDTFRYVLHKKYIDVIKSLIKDYGKKGYLLQDSLASCMKNFDDKKKGYRNGLPIKAKLKTLPPDKHRNRLFGEALVLKVNILHSQTQKTPVGFGSLFISDTSSPFNGLTIDSLSKLGDEYLTFCSLSTLPAVTADELADVFAQLNSVFEGELDTNYWSGGKLQFTGAKPVGDIWYLKRASGVEPKIIPELSGMYEQVPLSYTLQQNYPNPFNPATSIEFALPEEALVTIRVYNMLGQEVTTIADHVRYDAGTNEVRFDAQALPSGVYFYRLYVNEPETGTLTFQQTKKMLLMK